LISGRAKGEQTVQFLVGRNRLESFEAEDLAALTEALVARATMRVETTATSALAGGDVDGAYVAAYDAYRMAAEALLARQAMRATGGDGSYIAVEDAVSAQFSAEIPVFAKSTFERLRRARHSAQYFDPTAAPLTASDATWAIEKAKEALSGVKALAGGISAGAFQLVIWQRQLEQGTARDRVVEGARS
jgi:hypothetical protein